MKKFLIGDHFQTTLKGLQGIRWLTENKANTMHYVQCCAWLVGQVEAGNEEWKMQVIVYLLLRR